MKVFMVEDAPIMLGNLLSILSGISGITVIGHAANGVDAAERIDILRPDLVILDINLRNGAGIGLLEDIKERYPSTKVMVVAGCFDEFYYNRCKRAGADYFFDKAFQLTRIRTALWHLVYADHLAGRHEALQSLGEGGPSLESLARLQWWPSFKAV